MQNKKIKIGKYSFPTECPVDCPGHFLPFSQGGLCYRCPIFNCREIGDSGMRLIEPQNYRQDWAEEWDNWFKNGMKGYPELFLLKKEN